MLLVKNLSYRLSKVYFIVFCLSSHTLLIAQYDNNSDSNFYKYENIKNNQNCESLNDNLLKINVTDDQQIEHLAKLTAYSKCLLKDKKIQECEHALNVCINQATDAGYYKIARQGLEEMSQLVSYYKPDLLVAQSQRKVKFDSLYSSPEQLLLSRGELVFTYIHLNMTKASLAQSEILIESAINTKSLCDGLFGKAISLQNKNPDLADSLYRTLITNSTTVDSFNRSSYYKKYGDFLLSQGKRVKAIDYLIEGINLTPNTSKYDLSRTGSLNNLSQLFFGLKQFDRARYYIDQSIQICEKNNYKSRNAVTAMINAQILSQEGKKEEAYQEIKNSRNYFVQRKDQLGQLQCLAVEGNIALSQQNKSKATMCKNSIDSILARVAGQIEIPLQVYGIKADYAMKYGSLDDKEKTLHAYLSASQKENDPVGKYFSLSGLYQLHKAKGNYKKALDLMEQHQAISDEIFETEQVLEVNKLESQFNRKGQDLQIEALDRENALKEKTLSLQKKTIIGTIAGLSLLGLLSILLYKINRKVNSQNQVIEKSLAEKDILLREIHHRVKNNLQLVSSLLTIQSKDIKDQYALDALQLGKSRVISMSLIHQDLYQKDKLTGINVKTYLEKLSSELFNTYNISEDQIDFRMHIENIDLDVDTLVPLGLIINELITNALKHAFPNGEKGTVFIEFKKEENNLVLSIKDNGVGLNHNKKVDTSFGNTLVRALAKQLDGKFEIDGSNGTQIRLIISDYKIAV